MKANLFELLLSLFEKTLSQLKETQQADSSSRLLPSNEVNLSTESKIGVEIQVFKQASSSAMRVFSADEQFKLTKASYQFLMRIAALDLIPPQTMELVMNRLTFSESRFVSLQETKWTIRHTLAQLLNPAQLAFLELVLYFKEDGLSLH